MTDGAIVTVSGTTLLRPEDILQFDGSSQLDFGLLIIDNATLRTLGASTFTNSATLDGNLYVDTFGFDSTFSGSFSNSGGLVKSGAGTLALAGMSSFTGPTSVNEGALLVSGSLTGTVSTSVSPGTTLEVDGLVNTSATNTLTGAGATLRGTGLVGAITANGGVISPGLTAANSASATGVMTAAGAVTLSGTTDLDIRLGLSNTGTDSDQLAVTGANAVALNGTLSLTLGPGMGNLAPGDVNSLVYVILNGSQPPTGTFSGFDINGSAAAVAGNAISSDGFTFDIYYDVNSSNTGPGDDVVLELAAIPEPGTWPMVIGGTTILALSRRTRRRPKA